MKANRLIPLALVASLAACTTARPPAPPAPAPAPILRPAPPPPRAADWRDLPQSAGDWRWSVAAGRSRAVFGTADLPALTLSCDAAARTVTVTRAGTAAGPAPLVITTTAQRRVLNAAPASAGIAAVLPARDSLLDAMAFSRGRFMVETPGLPALLVPSWPELSRVVEDCRG